MIKLYCYHFGRKKILEAHFEYLPGIVIYLQHFGVRWALYKFQSKEDKRKVISVTINVAINDPSQIAQIIGAAIYSEV